MIDPTVPAGPASGGRSSVQSESSASHLPSGSGPNQNAALHENAALQLQGLSKSYSGKVVVRDINLRVPRGSFYGLVGPNGSGKTTTVLMATGLLRPDAGTALVCGHNVWGSTAEANSAKAAYGMLADGLPVFDRLSGQEYLHYLGLLRGIDEPTVAQRSRELLDALDLADSSSKLIVDYSAGMTKKILLAGALLHRPDILILDEPFEAVDPVSATTIREILQAYVASSGTVIMSSHVMETVEALCDHVAVIGKNQVLADGTLDEVRAGSSLSERFVELVGGRHLAEGSLEWLAGAGQGSSSVDAVDSNNAADSNKEAQQ
ncbi:ABC transporter ATP-binding protein [Corynebacterium sp.]|uniref:ABC transporter ATP-binding protein n=1 Tax=Corynebacterium sp. TaxID=1720 RepID=UPI0027BABCDC|nr:ABC transporter ATP-binding protein [Corynebacterium sp.]